MNQNISGWYKKVNVSYVILNEYYQNKIVFNIRNVILSLKNT